MFNSKALLNKIEERFKCYIIKVLNSIFEIFTSCSYTLFKIQNVSELFPDRNFKIKTTVTKLISAHYSL